MPEEKKAHLPETMKIKFHTPLFLPEYRILFIHHRIQMGKK